MDYKSMKIWPNRLFLDRLALPHMLTNFWMCFCGILSNFHGLRRTFPKSVLEFRFAICLKFGETLLLVPRIWGKAPIRPFVLCQPIGVFPQIWGSIVALNSRLDLGNSRLDLGNVLLTSYKLKRMPHKHIQKLVNICGRANLSRNSLFGHIFIDL